MTIAAFMARVNIDKDQTAQMLGLGSRFHRSFLRTL